MSASAAAETRQILHAARAILADDHCLYIAGDHGVDIVCGLATGGLITNQWTAHVLELPGVFAEHDSPQSTVKFNEPILRKSP